MKNVGIMVAAKMMVKLLVSGVESMKVKKCIAATRTGSMEMAISAIMLILRVAVATDVSLRMTTMRNQPVGSIT